MELPLIYKYKPNYFSEYELDHSVLDILNTLISIDSLNILLIGDSGSGKTSLIYTLINEYYKDCSNKNDNILIINSLKEQGIQYYRSEVKTFCQTRCSIPGKKKLVILDDIDNINEQSQQVFRNCIDKYSNNVNFLSSCNNIQKVIDSLQSRKTIIKLKPLSLEKIKLIFNNVKLKEKVVITSDAENFILNICNGSLRILINYLEKFKILNKEINLELANQICTNISFNIFNDFTNYAKEGKRVECINILFELYDKGYSVMDIYDNYFLYLKQFCDLDENDKYKIITILCKYITIFHNIHEDEIELALFTNNLIQLLSS
jgi:DNA polymerase III delta prime subunit